MKYYERAQEEKLHLLTFEETTIFNFVSLLSTTLFLNNLLVLVFFIYFSKILFIYF